MEAFWRGGQYENFRVQYTETPLPYYPVSTYSCSVQLFYGFVYYYMVQRAFTRKIKCKVTDAGPFKYLECACTWHVYYTKNICLFSAVFDQNKVFLRDTCVYLYYWTTEIWFIVYFRTESGKEIHASATARGIGIVRETTVSGSADRESEKERESGNGRRRADAGRRNGRRIVWNETKKRGGLESGLPESHGRRRMRRRSRSNHVHPRTCHPGEFKASGLTLVSGLEGMLRVHTPSDIYCTLKSQIWQNMAVPIWMPSCYSILGVFRFLVCKEIFF